MNIQAFKELCLRNDRKWNKSCVAWFKKLSSLDKEGYNALKIADIMLRCSTETLEKICTIIENQQVYYYSNYDELMAQEGFSACSFMCGQEINETQFNALYDHGLLDDDKIYN